MPITVVYVGCIGVGSIDNFSNFILKMFLFRIHVLADFNDFKDEKAYKSETDAINLEMVISIYSKYAKHHSKCVLFKTWG